MKNQLIYNLVKRHFSVSSNLRPFLRNQRKNKTFWYFHGSDHFKDMTFRNEKCDQKSSEDTKLRQQLSDSIIKKRCHLSDIVLQEFPLTTKLYVLDTLSVIHGSEHKITVQFFDSLRPQIIFELQKQNIFVLIHILYLSSIIKTDNKSDLTFLLSKIIEKIEELLSNCHHIRDELCAKDIAVLFHSLFRLKLKLNANIIQQTIVDIIHEDIANNRLNRSHVLSIVKYLRSIELNDKRVIEAIDVFIPNNLDKLSFTEIVHYLAFYANHSLYDENIFKLLTDRCDQLFKDNETTFRSKDLARFLWSVSSINHKLEKTTIDSVVKSIETNISSDFLNFPHFLIDCFKSLIILGEYRSNLFVKIFDSKKWLKLFSVSERNKVSKDLYFILESIAIERPDIQFKQRTLLYSLAKEVKLNPNRNLKERSELSKYLQMIKDYAINAQIEEKPQLSYPLQHINITSIIFKGIYFEAIDPTVNFSKDGRHLSGLMATKIRQMICKDMKNFLIYDSEELKQYLSSI